MEIAQLARVACEDKKAADIRLLDMTKISDLTDYILVATGASAPQVKAIASEIEGSLKHHGVPCRRRAGDSECGWIVMDYLSVVIHVFHPRMRQYYAIEELWEKAPEVR